MDGCLLEIRTEEARGGTCESEAKPRFCSSVTPLNVKTEHGHLGQRHGENQSLFCRRRDGSVTIEIVYLYRGLSVERFSDVMESPCEDGTEDTVLVGMNERF